MGLSITTAFPLASFAAADANSATAPLPESETTVNNPTANNPPFVVQLTEAERVYQLNQQGQSVPQIASNLGLPEAAVNSYLGNTNSS